jgi:hypothetical protein
LIASNPGTIYIAAGTYSGAGNTGLTITTSNVSLVGNGSVLFQGGGTAQGWILSGNSFRVQNVFFSGFATNGTFSFGILRLCQIGRI